LKYRRSLIAVAVGTVSLALAGFLVAKNPIATAVSTSANPHELLRDVNFTGKNAWLTLHDTDSSIAVQRSGDEGFGYITGTVRQDIPLPPEPGRSYRFSAWVGARGDNKKPGVRGLLRAQTACGNDEEKTEVPFAFSDSEWHEIVAIVTPLHGEKCSLRVEIEGPPANNEGRALNVRDASFVDAGLKNPSFESSLDGWQITNGTNGSSLRSFVTNDAPDGKSVAEFVVGSSATSLVQDVALDQSSEAVRGRFSISARSINGDADLELRIHEPCSDRVTKVPFRISKNLQNLEVLQARLPTPSGELPVDPPVLIRPEGPECVMRVEVLVKTLARTIQLDSAYLDLRSYSPPLGSPRYQAGLKGYNEAEAQKLRDADSEVKVQNGRSLSEQNAGSLP
jgi:hypothetical protein